MSETTPEFHHLEVAFATSGKIIDDLPDHSIRNDLDVLKLKSYILLQHAAIEEYLEKVSMYSLMHAKSVFDESSIVTEPLLAACSYYNVDSSIGLSDPSNSFKLLDNLKNVFEKAINKHVTALEGVHGIKTKDQDAILNPIGIRIHDFDHVLSQMLNGLGVSRGGVAHTFRIRQAAPRIALEQRGETLLRLLQGLDNEICRRMTLPYN